MEKLYDMAAYVVCRFDIEGNASRYSEDTSEKPGSAAAVNALLNAGAEFSGRTLTEELNLGYRSSARLGSAFLAWPKRYSFEPCNLRSEANSMSFIEVHLHRTRCSFYMPCDEVNLLSVCNHRDWKLQACSTPQLCLGVDIGILKLVYLKTQSSWKHMHRRSWHAVSSALCWRCLKELCVQPGSTKMWVW